jgi:Uma2 family endonuclease
LAELREAEKPVFLHPNQSCFLIMTITSLDQLDPNGTYTYADYWSWQFPERVELLRGKVRLLETPMRFYHKSRGKLFYYIANALWKKTTEIYLAPFDVRLTRSFPTPDDEVYTVVQPAISIICDPAKLDERGCNGAPDLIIEILSPGNSRTEMKDKFELYQEAGVLEYWVVSPSEKTIQIWTLDEQGIYISRQPKVEGDIATTPIIPNLAVDVTEVFLD